MTKALHYYTFHKSGSYFWRIRLVILLSFCFLVGSCAATFAAAAPGIQSRSVGNGKTIVFVHGWTCDQSFWDQQVSAFSNDYRVVTLDLPGHGRSEMPENDAFSMDLFAAAVETARIRARADRIVLVGHSMGAMVIRQYALDYPEHVAGLVAVDGPLDLRPKKGQPRPDEAELTLEIRSSIIDSMFVPATSVPLRAKIKNVMLGTSAVTAKLAGEAMADPSIQSDRKIMAPALTIFSGVSPSAGDVATREVLPNWEWSQIPETGHFLMMEKPQEFNVRLRKFLEERAEYQKSSRQSR